MPTRGRPLYIWLRANVGDHMLDVAYDFVFTTPDGDVLCPMRLDYRLLR